MTVLLLNQYGPPDTSPTARLLGDLATFLRSRGHTVVIVAQQKEYHGRPARGLERLRREMRALFDIGITSLTIRPKPEVVLALSSPPGLLALAALVAARHRAALAHWAMDLYPELAVNLGEIPAGTIASVVTRVMRWAYRKTDLLVALDDDMAKHLQATYGVEPRTLPPWPARLRVADQDQTANPAAGAALAGKEWTWLYSGNLGRAHEWRVLIDVQAELENRALPIQLLFEGGGAAWNEARQYGEERHLARCHWTGYVSETESFRTVRSSQLIVATQRRSAQGLLWPSKLARVMPLDKPLLWIGPSDGAIAQSLNGRSSTRCFEPDSLREIADWIEQLWSRRDQRPPPQTEEEANRLFVSETGAGCETLERWLLELPRLNLKPATSTIRA